MAAFTAADVKKLRDMTGIGMMDCKKALVEADGDIDKAVEILREKGLAAWIKKGGRIAAEGVVTAKVEGNSGVVVEVNAETDFVAKNADFLSLVDKIADIVLNNKPADVEALLALDFGDGDNVEAALREAILRIGENIKVRRFYFADGTLESYVHAGGSIGVLVEFETDAADKPEFKTLAKDVALQIAAMSPKYLAREDVPDDYIESEKEILLTQALNEGKPKEIAEKMVLGRVGKLYSEICLLEQPFVKEDKISVADHVKNVAKELGANITIKAFTRFEKGEGIEKKEDNFADEVASMIQ